MLSALLRIQLGKNIGGWFTRSSDSAPLFHSGILAIFVPRADYITTTTGPLRQEITQDATKQLSGFGPHPDMYCTPFR